MRDRLPLGTHPDPLTELGQIRTGRDQQPALATWQGQRQAADVTRFCQRPVVGAGGLPLPP